VYSATKALCGHGNALAGLVVESGTFDYGNGRYPHFEKELWALRGPDTKGHSILEVLPGAPFVARIKIIYLNYLGATLDPFAAYLILLGIDSLTERVQKQVSNTLAVLAYLESNPHVSWVAYPSAASSEYKALAQKYLPKGAGTVLSFGFAGTQEQMYRFLDATKVFSYQANIGDARSLIVNPAQTTHIELNDRQRELSNLTPDTVRLSLGLESPRDLVNDLEQAFTVAFA
jgi:O-acetylhomoserine (thiol)-lyase